ncbi:heparan sulfate glucosamine 3-O-sulfotransferase 6-like isoform X1 [Palaemon carinicauda]|uniref:heparan sulfate glucosamine 3-O-sulfotransferase 6-like isoform X1 n=1 Tax=Palaemon carinicauda TaxID=392227 RepID=UPI0035B6765E
MHLPRRLCSLVGIFCVVLCCLFYVADYYDYYYARSAALSKPPSLEDVADEGIEEPRILPVSYLDLQENLTVDPSDWKDRQKLKLAQRSARDKRKKKCKKRINGKCRKLQTERDLQFYEEGEEEDEERGGGGGLEGGGGGGAPGGGGGGEIISLPVVVDEASYNSLENGSLEVSPVWSEFADRGYTIVGTNGSAMRRLPQVLIIGVKKAGTRALLAFLRVHPSIRAAGPEIHFFDRFYHKGLAWYRSQMPPSLEGQLTVEKTPAYFTTPEVPARVKTDLPDVRLLLVVRDPVTRAISDYAQGLSKHGFRKSFEELAFVNVTTGLVNSNWGPINGGLYAKHLKRWYEYFPRASIHFVSGENLVHDPAAELAKVQEFLGLRKVITDKHFFFNATKGFPCLVKRERSGRPHCLGSSKGRSHPTVSDATSDTLRDFYRPFNFKFFKMTGQKFHW